MAGKRISKDTRTSGSYTPEHWMALRRMLMASPDDGDLWDQAFDNFFQLRVRSRFLDPVATIERYTRNKKKGEGFAITAILCILIEYLQAYRQGCIYTPENPGLYEYNCSKSLFKNFLTQNEPFNFSRSDAARFYDNVRCGLLHEAATKGNAEIKVDGSAILSAGKTEFIIYRDALLKALERYLELYKEAFKSDTHLKINFFRKIDELNGIRRKLYFAYGSNLLKQQFELEREIFVHSCHIAQLKDYRLAFNKKSRKDPTISFANIEEENGQAVWGVIYEIDEQDFERLRKFEIGYDMQERTVSLLDGTPTKADTFISKSTCCARPSRDYVRRILEGASEKKLPREYIEKIGMLAAGTSA